MARALAHEVAHAYADSAAARPRRLLRHKPPPARVADAGACDLGSRAPHGTHTAWCVRVWRLKCAPRLSTVQEFLARLASGACRCMHASLPAYLQCGRGSSVPGHELPWLSRPVLPSPPSPLVRLYGSRCFLSSAGVDGWARGPRARCPLQACELASRSADRPTTT